MYLTLNDYFFDYIIQNGIETDYVYLFIASIFLENYTKLQKILFFIDINKIFLINNNRKSLLNDRQ